MQTTPTKEHPKHARKQARKQNAGPKTRRWSQHVTETSDALSLEPAVFRNDDPKRIAASLKRSAEHSRRRKRSPYASAMSMLTFYLNRAGRNLSPARKAVLRRAKDALRALFGRPAAKTRS